MNYIEIVKRAARITWRYKVLWILGILLALSGGGAGSGSNLTYSFGGNSSGMAPSMFPMWRLPDPGVIAGFVLLGCCLLGILIIVLTIVQYVARTGLYRAVDQIEETGAGVSWREGLRLGWSNRALRMFLLDLIVGIAVFLAAMLVLLIGAAPLLLLIFDNQVLRIFGIVATLGLELIMFLLIMVAVVVITVLQQFWRRQIALADRTIGQALSLGTQMVQRKPGDVAIFWLLMAVIGFVLAIVLIPVFFGLLAVASGVGFGLGYGAYALSNSYWLAVLVGAPFFLLIVGLPLLLGQGVYLVFESGAWTLVYRYLSGRPEQTALTPTPITLQPDTTVGT